MIQVVTAAIVNADEKRLFVQRRSGKTRYPWHWGLPGGQLHDGETLWLALLRELVEEHGITMRQDRRNELALQEPVYIHESTGMSVVCLRIPHTAIIGKIRANADAVAGFDWVTADELENLTLTPADDANRGVLMGLIR
jgi:8-oxo-dGTP diphosphatase